MNRYNRCFAGTAALALLAAMGLPPVAADDLLLEGNERLSGKVREINPDGTVLLETPLAPEVVALNGGQVSKVLFSASKVKVPPAGCQVVLANGDVLPGELESIDELSLTLRSSVAGPLVIPRAMVSSLALGASQPEVIFAGPSGLAGWAQDSNNDEQAQWSFDKGALRTRGPGMIGRNLELPQNFIVRFKLAWDAEPNFKFYFAGPANSEAGAVDQYYLQFGSAGLEIKRESASGKRFHEFNAQVSRLPDQFPGRRLEVEIRVDRSGRKLHLLLNDELAGVYKEPLAKSPTGGRMAFQSMAEGGNMRISEIEVLEWNLKDVPQPVKERGDKTKDVLKTVSKDSFSGVLTGTKPGPDGLLYVFQCVAQAAAIEVPEAELATLFFAVPAEEGPAPVPSPFSLKLLGGGSLRVSACTFAEDRVEATHPLLGAVKLERERITAFERVQSQPKAEKKSS